MPDVVCATCEQCGKALGWRYWEVSVVLGRAFYVTSEWATVGVLIDNAFTVLCMTSTAPIYHSVML